MPRGVGTGVVIVDNGTILTNLHVVQGAKRVTVTFYDGHESEAEFVGAQPDNDLAVIRAKSIPDDLPAATLGSTAHLQPGDEVVAVGFPFGIGPSGIRGRGLGPESRIPLRAWPARAERASSSSMRRPIPATPEAPWST